MVCKWCKEAYKDGRPEHFGSDPECAFGKDGIFKASNWNCAGMSILRAIGNDWGETDVPQSTLRSDDQTLSVIPWEGRFIVLSYYKNRGRTEGAWIVDADRIQWLNDSALASFELWLNEQNTTTQADGGQ